MVHLEDGVIKNWYLHNYKGDVIATLNDKGKILTDNVYSPYGMQYNLKNKQLQNIKSVFNLNNQESWWQIHVPGFDNQMNDPATGYQFLGGGYRAYNPVYRRFMSKDSYSPFEQIDGYGFVNNNPVMNTDPTGHMPRWTGYLFGVATIAVTAAVTAVFPVAAFISAATASSVEASVSSAISAGISSTILSVGTFGLGLASGSLQIASTAKPENMNLKKATDIINVASSLMLSTVADFGVLASGVGILTKASRVTNSFTLAASVLGDGAAVTAGAASGMSAASDWQPSLATKKGFNEAMKALNIASGVLTVFSIASAMKTMISAKFEIDESFKEAQKNKAGYDSNFNMENINSKNNSSYTYDDTELYDGVMEKQRTDTLERGETFYPIKNKISTGEGDNSSFAGNIGAIYSTKTDIAYVSTMTHDGGNYDYMPRSTWFSKNRSILTRELRKNNFRLFKLNRLKIVRVEPNAIMHLAWYLRDSGVMINSPVRM